MEVQKIENQKGEIEFRKKLYLQQVDGQQTIENEYNAAGIEKILQERVVKTIQHMKQLEKQGVVFSPYLEIGAERCQRTLAMENDLQARGAAVDISFDMLKSCEYYSKAFSKESLPLRVCCDANQLPFFSNSMPFVFCYETLHHFPTPQPIIAEIHRVLCPGGTFFFDEEPYKQVLHFNLLKGGKIYSEKELKRKQSTWQKIIDRFFRQKECNEVEHGIIENDEISLATWKKSLAVFTEKNIHLSATSSWKIDLFSRFSLKYFLSYLLGGKVAGTCRKEGDYTAKNNTILDTVICPKCLQEGHEYKLRDNTSHFICNECDTKYPVVEGVLLLFLPEKLQALYPELSSLEG